MRGLNLSRLGRASEGKFFADRQAEQAAITRAKLTKEEVNAVRSRAQDSSRKKVADVNVVAAIAGHSVYERLAVANARAAAEAEKTQAGSSTLARRLNNPNSNNLATSKLQTRGVADGFASIGPDAGVMRAMGRNRMAVYHQLRDEAGGRPLPGSEVRAEGAVVGIQAFVVATALVGSVGMSGILYLYFTPRAVDSLRMKSVRFREQLESGPIGQRLRKTAEFYREEGALLSPEAQEGARVFANKAVKTDSVSRVAIGGDSDPPQGASQSST